MNLSKQTLIAITFWLAGIMSYKHVAAYFMPVQAVAYDTRGMSALASSVQQIEYIDGGK